MGFFASFRSRPPGHFDVAAEQRLVAEAVLRSAAALLHVERSASEVIAAHCEALTTLAPHLVLAWVWFGPPDTATVRPQVVAGPAREYAHKLVIERNALTRLGPAFRTLEGKPLEPFAVSALSPFAPWRDVAHRHGVRSVLALPLMSSFGNQRGLFVLYADVDRYFEQVGVGVFDALAQLFNALLTRTARNAELARAANCDALTGLANRNAVLLLEPVLQRVTDSDPPCAVLVLDIDHFKRINDTHGHATGDAVLRAVAHRLRATVRGSDTVARWGGEEFVICLPGMAAGAAHALAEKLREHLASEALLTVGEAAVRATASVGVAGLRSGETVAQAIDRADEALYAAKRAGRNRVMQAETAEGAAQAQAQGKAQGQAVGAT